MRRALLVIALAAVLATSFNMPCAAESYEQDYYKDDAYLDAYYEAVLRYNSRLTDAQADEIVMAILYYSNYYGIDPRLTTAVIACESAFRPDAISPAGAVGLGQLMPETARSHKLNPRSITQNIHGACRVLCTNLKRYGDDGSYRDKGTSYTLELALAAYNAGPGAVEKYGGIPPYRETRDYISRVVAEYQYLCGF